MNALICWVDPMLWNRIRQAIYAVLTVVGFIWTNYYLVQFAVATKGELTANNLLNFDISTFIAQPPALWLRT
jgi:hypothetical protein